MVEVRTLVPKRAHDILKLAAAAAGVPISTLVNHMLGHCIAELAKGATDESSNGRLESDQDRGNHEGSAPGVDGGGGSADNLGAPEGTEAVHNQL